MLHTFRSDMNNYISKIQKSFQRIELLFTSDPSLLLVKSKIRLNACILRLNFRSDFANGFKPRHPSCTTDCDLKMVSVL